METNSFLTIEKLREKKKTIGLIHKVYLSQLKNSYKHTASTKTKSEVRGGGKKPWRQKGTGNARAGSTRSPLWVGGGVVFGPKPRVVHRKINKKEKRLAILSAFYLKKNECRFVENGTFENFQDIKSKKVLEILRALNPEENAKILFILKENNKNFWLSSRNLKNVEVTTVNCLNIKQLLKTNYIILSNSALESINLIYGKHHT